MESAISLRTVNFSDAHDFHVETFNQTHANAVYQMASSPTKSPMDRLLDNIEVGAVHDADERCDSPKCHPQTRVAVQEDILSWIAHGDHDAEPKRLMWITGPAGSGKTAIAGTLAEQCHQLGSLAASFFFSSFFGSQSRRSKRRLIPTLAYQLMQHKALRGLKDKILPRIERDPVVFQKRLREQLEILILKPLRSLRLSAQAIIPKVIIIDGLDECEADLQEGRSSTEIGAWRSREEVHKEVLLALLQAVGDSSFPFRIIVVSRPEPVIRNFFNSGMGAEAALQIFLGDSYNPNADIALFLEAKFAELRRRYYLPLHWPKESVIPILVEQASGQFIYPATIIRFIEDTGEPVRQLKRILEWRANDQQEVTQSDDSSPFAALDLLYARIFRTASDPILAVKWIHAFRFLEQETPALRSEESTAFIKAFLESSQGEMMTVLGQLTSLLSLEGTKTRPGFHLYHKTLVDFLTDMGRCKGLYISQAKEYEFLRERWYQITKHKGFQVPVESTDRQTRFLVVFSHMPRTWPTVHFMDPRRDFRAPDARWWLQCLGPSPLEPCIQHMFRTVHTKCHWYRCHPSCKAWRKQILRYSREKSLPAPGRVELFFDRFLENV